MPKFHIIIRGFAWFYRAYARDLARNDATEYEAAEARAKREKRGLWTDPNPTPPWDFRRGLKPKPAVVKSLGVAPTPVGGPIIGNRDSKIYHRPDCPDYGRVSERNRVAFKNESEAQQAGYRRAKNCP